MNLAIRWKPDSSLASISIQRVRQPLEFVGCARDLQVPREIMRADAPSCTHDFVNRGEGAPAHLVAAEACKDEENGHGGEQNDTESEESPREIFRRSSYCAVVTAAGKFNGSPQ